MSKTCPICNRQISVGTNGIEYGHERGKGDNGPRERCPRRPAEVDPQRYAPEYDGWVEAGETV